MHRLVPEMERRISLRVVTPGLRSLLAVFAVHRVPVTCPERLTISAVHGVRVTCPKMVG